MPAAGHDIIGIEPVNDEFNNAVKLGLSAAPKSLECKYLYDDSGSQLFEEICNTPEYYPTRTEVQILTDCAGDIAKTVGEDVEIVEFGSGASLKTRLLLQAFRRPSVYVPVDISAQTMWRAAEALQRNFPRLVIVPTVADFTEHLHIEQRGGQVNRLLFFPGSTIGNFETAQAIELLARWRRELAPNHFVIGFDLIKDKEMLEAAYDDAAGITAAFNLNLLHRINTELDGTFDMSGFRHEARYNETKRRVEMHIVSLKAQNVRVGDLEVSFASGESIHTENCHKYSCASFEQLVSAAGWSTRCLWTDKNDLFAVALLQPIDAPIC